MLKHIFFVSHSGKQYVHRFIQALLSNNYEVRFCTPLWWQKVPAWLNILPGRLKKKLLNEIRKKSFSFKGSISLVEQPTLILKKELRDRNPFIRQKSYGQFLLEQEHDLFAARELVRAPLPLVIGYEISSLYTFQQAKKNNVITVLDLAQVHYKTINNIANQFSAMLFILDNPELQNIEQRKQKEYDLADYIMTLSSFARETMIKEGIPEDKLYEVHLGFDVQLFTPKTTYSAHGPLRIMICGTDMVRKGLGMLLEVVQRMESDGFELELIIIGPISEVEGIITKHGTTKRLISLPFMPHEELVQQYQKADVFVFPSYLDSWAMTVLESMACGTPVVVTENTGSKDAVRKGGGMVIETGSKDALMDAIKTYYNNRSLIESDGRQARAVAMEYTWDNYYKEIGIVMEDIRRKSGLN